MDELIATIFVSTSGLDRNELAGILVQHTSATVISPTIGRLDLVEFEIRNNPDNAELGHPGPSWLHYPYTIECYAETESCSRPEPGPNLRDPIELLLDALGHIGAQFVTSSSLEQDLPEQGRNRPLLD